MHRKKFIQTSLSAAVGLSVMGLAACKPTNAPITTNELSKLDALGLADLIQRKKLSPKELLLATIQRIEALDEQIGAVTIRDFEAAMKRAENIDTSLPFAGIPLLRKDGTDYGQVIRPHNSRFFKNYKSQGKSPIVKKYEALGFNFIGYSKTPEFNNMAGSTEPLLSSPCRNPWNLDKSVGASSGGAAAAIAAGYVPLAHGTVGGGSLRIPASACGVFGFAPSQYRMLSGQLDGEHNLFTRHHALSRSVRDNATLFYHTQGNSKKERLSPLPLVQAASKKRLKIGLVEKGALQIPLESAIREGLEKSAKLLTNLGHTVEKTTLDINGGEFFKSYFILFGAKMKALINAVEQATGQKAEATNLLEPLTVGMARDLELYTATDTQNALAYMTGLKRKLQVVFSNYDFLMSPVTARLLPKIGYLKPDKPYDFLYKKNTEYMEYTVLQNMTESTAMSVPLHWTTENLPVGIQFAAAVGQENRLLELAFELEAAQPWKDRRPVI